MNMQHETFLLHRQHKHIFLFWSQAKNEFWSFRNVKFYSRELWLLWSAYIAKLISEFHPAAAPAPAPPRRPRAFPPHLNLAVRQHLPEFVWALALKWKLLQRDHLFSFSFASHWWELTQQIIASRKQKCTNEPSDGTTIHIICNHACNDNLNIHSVKTCSITLTLATKPIKYFKWLQMNCPETLNPKP